MAKVLFFGKLKEITGYSELRIKEIKDIEELKNYLFEKYPPLKEEVFLISVNHKIIDKDVSLKENDEVALLPPISGG